MPAAWRISVAEITRSGDFSRFENTERLSVLLRGPGLQLHCNGIPHYLDHIGSLVRYQGADATSAVLGSSPARFLNVMVAHGHAEVSAHANPVELDEAQHALVLIMVAQGAVALRTKAEPPLPMQEGQFVLLNSSPCPIKLQATAPDSIWVAVVLNYQLRGGA